jgi:hypothetical protein
LGSVSEIRNFLFSLSGDDETRRRALGIRRRNQTISLSDVLGGFMTEDEFRRIVGVRGENLTDASVLGRGAIALSQDEDNIGDLLTSLVGSGSITEEQRVQTLGRIRRSRKSFKQS